MSDKGRAAGRGGSGLLTAGAVIALVIAAGTYLSMRDSGGPTQEELSALVAPGSQEADEAPLPGTAASPVPEAPSEEAVSEETEAPADTGTDDTTGTTSDDTAVVAEDTVSPLVPRIDEVRVDGDGILIVAGRAAPDSWVRVLLDGVEAATATADSRGAFAAVALIGPSEAARVLTLDATTEGVTVNSEGEIILAPVAAPVVVAEAETPSVAPTGSTAPAQTDSADDASEDGEPVAIAQVSGTRDTTANSGVGDTAGGGTNAAGAATSSTDETPAVVAAAPSGTAEADASAGDASGGSGDQIAAATQDAIGTETPADAAAGPGASTTGEPAQADAPAVVAGAPLTPQTPEAPQTDGAQAVAVLKSDAEGVSLLQTAPAAPKSIRLDTIGYSSEGVVELSGRAGSGAREVRVYLDNRAILSLPMDANGNWRGEVPDIDAGVYTLRVDAVDADGQVTSRIETPFKREAPQVLAAAADRSGQDGPVRAVTVQAGDTLWAIARDRYGEGLLYVQVFEANRSAIRDPDLIYPGQVFDLPSDN